MVVHESSDEAMSFLDKNFKYTSMRFGDFVDGIEAGRRLYLRALSTDEPAGKATSLALDYPSLSPDFELPPELARVATNAHSSPLRLSGPVTMWLHYDVMANILCQIRGRKRLVLFSPQAVGRLGFPPGASSSRLQVFNMHGNVSPALSELDPVICDLDPGDTLFIPPLWAHTAFPVDRMSVAVNVFFRSLDAGYAAGKDVYGNRDVQAYENGRKDVRRIQRAFEGLPRDVSAFYLRRLAMELEEAAKTR